MTEKMNDELAVLGTHQAGMTDSFKTLITQEPQIINPPEAGTGQYDKRQEERQR